MADFPDSTSTPKIDTHALDFDIEGTIDEAYGASIVLVEIAENTFSKHKEERDEAGFRVFRLNDEQVKALFYLVYALRGHARNLSEGFYAEAAAKVQS